MKRLIPIAIITAICLAIAGYVIRVYEDSRPLADSITFDSVKSWQSEDGTFYVFLPSFTDMSNLSVENKTRKKITIDGGAVGETLKVDLNEKHDIVFGKQREHIVFMKSANLPAVFIDTDSGNMDYVNKEKGNKESAEAVIIDTAGKTVLSEKISVSGHGNGAWIRFKKKSINVAFKEPVSVLGMNPSRNWVLLSNSVEATNIRTKLVFDFASKAKLRWTPRGEPADVYLNGEYAGLYLLAERIEAAPDKMNLSDKDFLGQLKSKTMIGKNDAAFLIDGGSYFEIKFPVNPSERRLSEIEKSVKNASRALLNNSDNLFDILNIDSFARMFLIDEIFMDMDADINSSYYYSDGGKICAGPAWDYDRSMANMNSDVSNLKIKYPNQIYCAEPYSMPHSGDISCLRYSRLYRNKRFRQRLAEIYKNEYRALLVNTVKDISVLGETVSASDAMESVRYKAMRQRFDAEYYKDTREEISDIKSLLEAHLAFLDSVFIDGKEYKSVWFSAPDFRIRPPKRYSVAELYIVDHRAVEVGSKVENVLGKKMYISGTDTVFDFNTPITDNITLLTKPQSELEADIRRYKETK